MANLRNKNPIRVIIILAVLFITFAMGFLCSRISQVLMDFDSSGTADVARRVSSPDDSWTAILVRSYSFIDLNFALYITDDEMADITDPHGIAQFYLGNEPYVKDSPLWIRRALWISKDYDPSNFYFRSAKSLAISSSTWRSIVSCSFIYNAKNRKLLVGFRLYPSFRLPALYSCYLSSFFSAVV